MRSAALVLIALVSLAACEGPTVSPEPRRGFIRPEDPRTGYVAQGDTRLGVFEHDFQIENYAITLDAGESVLIDFDRSQTKRGLDTKLMVLGPADADGDYPSTPIAVDLDSGYGTLAMLTFVAPADGDYLVQVTTQDGRGRGAYAVRFQ